jgi:DNA-binding MarR family transcriptional regulator
MSESDKRPVNVKLSPEQQAQIEAVRQYYNLENNTEVLRLLISNEARRLFENAPLFAGQQEAQ